MPGLLAAPACCPFIGNRDEETVMTVNGPPASSCLHYTLTHMHILVVFIGRIFYDYNCNPDEFIPAIKQKGFAQEEMDKILIANTARAFTIRVRKTEA